MGKVGSQCQISLLGQVLYMLVGNSHSTNPPNQKGKLGSDNYSNLCEGQQAGER